jgi:hypothetical protein
VPNGITARSTKCVRDAALRVAVTGLSSTPCVNRPSKRDTYLFDRTTLEVAFGTHKTRPIKRFAWDRQVALTHLGRWLLDCTVCGRKLTSRKALETMKELIMNAQRTILASVGMVLFFAGASSAQQVKTDYDRSANFGQYRTYSWEKVQTQNQLWAPRIQEAVNATLAAKGLTPVASGGNIAIVAIETTQNQQTLNTFYDGFGGGWRWRGFGGFGDSTTTVENYKVGTLVVICSTLIPRPCCGGDRRATPFQTSQTKTSRIWTRACRKCSIIFLPARRNRPDVRMAGE